MTFDIHSRCCESYKCIVTFSVIIITVFVFCSMIYDVLLLGVQAWKVKLLLISNV